MRPVGPAPPLTVPGRPPARRGLRQGLQRHPEGLASARTPPSSAPGGCDRRGDPFKPSHTLLTQRVTPLCWQDEGETYRAPGGSGLPFVHLDSQGRRDGQALLWAGLLRSVLPMPLPLQEHQGGKCTEGAGLLQLGKRKQSRALPFSSHHKTKETLHAAGGTWARFAMASLRAEQAVKHANGSGGGGDGWPWRQPLTLLSNVPEAACTGTPPHLKISTELVDREAPAPTCPHCSVVTRPERGQGRTPWSPFNAATPDTCRERVTSCTHVHIQR